MVRIRNCRKITCQLNFLESNLSVEKSKNKEVIKNDHGNNTPSLLTRSIENLQEETNINVFPHDLYAYSGCFKVRIYLLDCEIIYLK